MEVQDNELLYMDLKKKICALIYKGIYQEGEKIPPERVLAEEFNVSRITVRKTLELLEKEGIVIREIGRGTTVCFPNRGSKGNLDMIALIAPAKSTFFTEFITFFQRHLEQNDILLLYVQKPEMETIANCIYRLYQKDIRNVVVWPDDAPIERESLRRLRALGMNMVFFDTDITVPYADCVHLDNEAAITELRMTAKEKEVYYIGWDNEEVYSVWAREKCFREKGGKCLRLSWNRREELKTQIYQEIKPGIDKGMRVPVFLCGAGEIGVEVAKALRHFGVKETKVASIDEFKDSRRLKITTYGQDFVAISEKIYDCLKMQNEEPQKWKGKCWPIQGVLVER